MVVLQEEPVQRSFDIWGFGRWRVGVLAVKHFDRVTWWGEHNPVFFTEELGVLGTGHVLDLGSDGVGGWRGQDTTVRLSQVRRVDRVLVVGLLLGLERLGLVRL